MLLSTQMQTITTEGEYESSSATTTTDSTEPLKFAQEVIAAVSSTFEQTQDTDTCVYFPGGSVVGIAKAFEDRSTLAQCAGFLRSHALKLGAECACVVVLRGLGVRVLSQSL